MDAFMSALIKMSLRGIVIILIVLLVRVLLKKLHIGHKYILGLWVMAFLYFIIPWKPKGMEKLAIRQILFENASKSVEMGLSANNGVISFWQDGRVVFEHN